MLCFLRGMAFIPILLVTWLSSTFIISYVVAVLSGHVSPFLPYISDTGTTPPESGIFGFMINFSAFLGAATMYTRYKIVEKQNQTSYFSTLVFNLVSLVLGLVGCIRMGIVANFQELAVPMVHDGGAFLAFVCGVMYTLLQSIISYKSCPQWNSLSTCRIRMATSAVSSAAVIPRAIGTSLVSGSRRAVVHGVCGCAEALRADGAEAAERREHAWASGSARGASRERLWKCGSSEAVLDAVLIRCVCSLGDEAAENVVLRVFLSWFFSSVVFPHTCRDQIFTSGLWRVRKDPPQPFLPLGIVWKGVFLGFSCRIVEVPPFPKLCLPPLGFIFDFGRCS
nr:DNA damage-regulated autophagy modulator protein 1-like [Globicephala melas]